MQVVALVRLGDCWASLSIELRKSITYLIHPGETHRPVEDVVVGARQELGVVHCWGRTDAGGAGRGLRAEARRTPERTGGSRTPRYGRRTNTHRGNTANEERSNEAKQSEGKHEEARQDLPSFGARVIAITPLLLPLLWIYEWI